MKSVLLTGIIVNHESPISRSDREVEYKIIGLKGIDLYTLSETELSINESATRDESYIKWNKHNCLLGGNNEFYSR